MNILDDLLASLPDEDVPVSTVLVGVHWTVVGSRHYALASTMTGNKPHGHEQVRDVGRLHLKPARELAEYARSDNPLEASIGVAAINSLLEADYSITREKLARSRRFSLARRARRERRVFKILLGGLGGERVLVAAGGRAMNIETTFAGAVIVCH